mmetsp:Transcript_78235/g.198848  ORF Transcript_78235/g.198848 Transcript_78235/m.198848 type:complete len:206 (-) Transcript_78235:43-660(-)
MQTTHPSGPCSRTSSVAPASIGPFMVIGQGPSLTSRMPWRRWARTPVHTTCRESPFRSSRGGVRLSIATSKLSHWTRTSVRHSWHWASVGHIWESTRRPSTLAVCAYTCSPMLPWRSSMRARPFISSSTVAASGRMSLASASQTSGRRPSMGWRLLAQAFRKLGLRSKTRSCGTSKRSSRIATRCPGSPCEVGRLMVGDLDKTRD